MTELIQEAYDAEVHAGQRFEFGHNWARFLSGVTETHLQHAKDSLRTRLHPYTLHGKTFLDIGSGSGLSSLAACRLGATVHSFDYDLQSVACTRAIKRRYWNHPDVVGDWTLGQGSVLDRAYLASLGTYDVVYSWGVLHHTGAMWEALENLVPLVKPGGRLFVAIYNDQGRASRAWRGVKRLYNRLPESLKWLVLLPAFVRLWGPTLLRDSLKGQPWRSWQAYGTERGMSPWVDVVDWVGGYPFEVAKPEEVFDFYRDRGFTLVTLKTAGGGLGCNEFVFEREP